MRQPDPLSRHASTRFREAFGAGPTGLVRAPGRVNLIGDHIDYHGLPVFPMAIGRGIRLAFRPRDDNLIRLLNTDAAFPPVDFGLEQEIVPGSPGSWGNYSRAAAQTLASRLPSVRGFDAVVGSDLPQAAGLSSSSALVVASALALLRANGVECPPEELGPLLACGERYVGTEGGGMDQAVCLGGREGHAIRIDFDPLRLTPVPVPDEWAFVITQSREVAQKSGAAREQYNLRVRESRAGLAAGDRAAGIPARRRRHVLSEADRVERAVEAMRRDDPVEFGRLMTDSHRSLRDDCEVSTPELDRLVELMIERGALGARLTGAGFGGCVVALTQRSEVDRLSGTDRVFVAEPSAGARVIAL